MERFVIRIPENPPPALVPAAGHRIALVAGRFPPISAAAMGRRIRNPTDGAAGKIPARNPVLASKGWTAVGWAAAATTRPTSPKRFPDDARPAAIARAMP